MSAATSAVEATLNYLGEMSERPAYYLYEPPPGERWRNTRGDRRVVEIRDARGVRPEPSLDAHGFALAQHETRLDDAWDDEAVREVYYPEMEALVAALTGAERVMAFDHNVRSAERAERGADGAQSPVRFVHNDYTEGSGPQRVRDLLPPDEAAARLPQRFAVINVWKPIRGPVLATPLAFLDARSVLPADFVETDLRYRDRTGEVYSVHFAPRHRWYSYSHMQADEALLLKCYDSADGLARFTAHTAFDHPATAPDAPARESIEVRTMAFFAPDA